MLVLSRKPNERILIGNNIEIVIVEICGNKVRLGVECPKAISILRKEIAKSAEETGSSTGRSSRPRIIQECFPEPADALYLE